MQQKCLVGSSIKGAGLVKKNKRKTSNVKAIRKPSVKDELDGKEPSGKIKPENFEVQRESERSESESSEESTSENEDEGISKDEDGKCDT